MNQNLNLHISILNGQDISDNSISDKSQGRNDIGWNISFVLICRVLRQFLVLKIPSKSWLLRIRCTFGKRLTCFLCLASLWAKMAISLPKVVGEAVWPWVLANIGISAYLLAKSPIALTTYIRIEKYNIINKYCNSVYFVKITNSKNKDYGFPIINFQVMWKKSGYKFMRIMSGSDKYF